MPVFRSVSRNLVNILIEKYHTIWAYFTCNVLYLYGKYLRQFSEICTKCLFLTNMSYFHNLDNIVLVISYTLIVGLQNWHFWGGLFEDPVRVRFWHPTILTPNQFDMLSFWHVVISTPVRFWHLSDLYPTLYLNFFFNFKMSYSQRAFSTKS